MDFSVAFYELFLHTLLTLDSRGSSLPGEDPHARKKTSPNRYFNCFLRTTHTPICLRLREAHWVIIGPSAGPSSGHTRAFSLGLWVVVKISVQLSFGKVADFTGLSGYHLKCPRLLTLPTHHDTVREAK